MKSKIFLFLTLVFPLLATSFSCVSSSRKDLSNSDSLNSQSQSEKNKALNESDSDDQDNFQNGEYCADIEYFNPKTRKNSTYVLIVDVENEQISDIQWRMGGVLDHDLFNGGELDDNGHTSFQDDRGREYRITISGPAEGCFDKVEHYVQCEGKNVSGRRCKRFTMNANNLCWQHQKQLK
jgi:hypothetical protein